MYNSHYEKILATGEVKCIDDEIPFEIPESWEWERLGNIATIIGGFAFPSESIKSNKGFRVIRISDFSDGKILENQVVRYNGNLKLSQYQIYEKDILMAMTGGTVGKTVLVPTISETMLLNQRVALIRNSYIYEKYVYAILISSTTQEVINSQKNSTNDNISMGNIYNFLVPLPSLVEQKRIVDKLEELFPIVEKYGKVQKEFEDLNQELPTRLRQSILQYAIQGKLVPQIDAEESATILLEKIRAEKLQLLKEGKLKKKDIQDSVIFKDDDNRYYEKKGKEVTEITDDLPFEIPNSWQWCRLSNIANLYTGNSINEAEKNAKYTNVQGTEYIATKDVKFDNSIDYQNGVAIPEQYVTNFRIAPAKSVLMCIEGGSAGRKIGILEQEVCFGNKLCCFAPYIDISEYIFYYLQSPLFFEIFSSNKNGIIGGVSVNNLKQLFIPLPPLNEITRIVNKIKAILKSIEG